MMSQESADSVTERNENNMTSFLEGTRLELNPDSDVADLFKTFNETFFWNKLIYVEVRWSPRMTLCAGVCVYHRRPGYCSIRLSRPLLSLRPKKDLVETLLHEMIHAFLFVTENNRDRDGHGPEFLKHMFRINSEVGLNISVFHSFNEEVKYFQQHVWLCDGPCQRKPPYFGKVHRSMNRAPGPNDLWWPDHESDCGGAFSKIAEPEGFVPKNYRKKSTSDLTLQRKGSFVKSQDIRTFFQTASTHHESFSSASPSSSKKLKLDGKSNLNADDSYSEHVSKKKKIVQNVDDIDNESTSKIHIEQINEKKEIVQNVVDIDNESTSKSQGDVLSDDSDDQSSGSNDEGFFGIFGSIFSYPFRRSKTLSSEPDPCKVNVRKPNLKSIPKSKRGTLRNLIKVPDQPTLDSFYQNRKPVTVSKKSEVSVSKLSQQKKESMRQPSLLSFLKN